MLFKLRDFILFVSTVLFFSVNSAHSNNDFDKMRLSCEQSVVDSCFKVAAIALKSDRIDIALSSLTKICSWNKDDNCKSAAALFLESKSTTFDKRSNFAKKRIVDQSRVLLHDACELDFAEACSFVAEHHYGQSEKERAGFFNRACLLEQGSACLKAGHAYVELAKSSGIESHLMQGSTNFLKACKKHDIQDGCYMYARMQLADPSDTQSTELGLASLESLCDVGHVGSCEYLGAYYVTSEAEDHLALAALAYGKACELPEGSASSCSFASSTYSIAASSIPDNSKKLQEYANRLARIGCEKSDIRSCMLAAFDDTLPVNDQREYLMSVCRQWSGDYALSACQTLAAELARKAYDAQLKKVINVDAWKASVMFRSRACFIGSDPKDCEHSKALDGHHFSQEIDEILERYAELRETCLETKDGNSSACQSAQKLGVRMDEITENSQRNLLSRIHIAPDAKIKDLGDYDTNRKYYNGERPIYWLVFNDVDHYNSFFSVLDLVNFREDSITLFVFHFGGTREVHPQGQNAIKGLADRLSEKYEKPVIVAYVGMVVRTDGFFQDYVAAQNEVPTIRNLNLGDKAAEEMWRQEKFPHVIAFVKANGDAARKVADFRLDGSKFGVDWRGLEKTILKGVKDLLSE